jgi:DNA-binding NtrC family response regulator
MLLPRATGAVHDAAPVEEQSEQRRHARILIIEDNPDVTEVTAALVMQLCYTVRLAPNAETAVGMIDEEAFDLVFSDIMMPGDMDGLEFAHLLRRIRPTLPVLLASGSNQRVEEAQDHFMTLQKPYDLAGLDRAIQRLLHVRDGATGGQNLVDLQKAKRLRATKTDKL